MLCVSGPVDPEPLAAGLDALRFAGLDPVTYPSLTDPGTMRPYLAGDDAMRARDLRAALTDPGIAGILFARGGYGAQRTLEAMDWDGLGPDGLPPKVLAGYSDVTAVLEAVAVRFGWASLFSPMAAIRDGAAHYSFGSLLRTLMRPDQAMTIRYPQAVTLVPGVAHGVTTGGTLSLLTSSLGTGTSRPARGGILLLEDVGEEPYRVDRMLTQLRRSGYLERGRRHRDGHVHRVRASRTDPGHPGRTPRPARRPDARLGQRRTRRAVPDLPARHRRRTRRRPRHLAPARPPAQLEPLSWRPGPGGPARRACAAATAAPRR